MAFLEAQFLHALLELLIKKMKIPVSILPVLHLKFTIESLVVGCNNNNKRTQIRTCTHPFFHYQLYTPVGLQVNGVKGQRKQFYTFLFAQPARCA